MPQVLVVEKKLFTLEMVDNNLLRMSAIFVNMVCACMVCACIYCTCTLTMHDLQIYTLNLCTVELVQCIYTYMVYTLHITHIHVCTNLSILAMLLPLTIGHLVPVWNEYWENYYLYSVPIITRYQSFMLFTFLPVGTNVLFNWIQQMYCFICIVHSTDAFIFLTQYTFCFYVYAGQIGSLSNTSLLDVVPVKTSSLGTFMLMVWLYCLNSCLWLLKNFIWFVHSIIIQACCEE